MSAKQQVVAPGSIFKPEPASALGKAFANQDPITTVLSAATEHQGERGVAEARTVHRQGPGDYVKLVKLAPEDATYQFQLARLAQSLGRDDVAKKAYKTFLKLAPNDSLAPAAKAAAEGVLTATAAKPADR